MPTPPISFDRVLWNQSTPVGYFKYYGTGPFVRTGFTNSMQRWDGESRPAGRTNRLSASGWRQPMNWSHRKWVVRDLQGTFVYGATSFPLQDNGVPGKVDVGGSGKRVAVLPIPANAERAAIAQALLALKNQKVNLSVAFAERKDTARLFSNTCIRIANSVNEYKRRRRKDWLSLFKRGARRQGRQVPQSWLELQYGWKPLMSDVYGSVEALNSRERDGDAYRAHVKGRRSESSERFVERQSVDGPFRQQLTVNDEWGVYVSLYYELANPLLATLSQLGITNPAEVIWERVPFSFVVDWALPIGEYLQTLDADIGWRFKSGTISRVQRLAARGGQGYTVPAKYSWVILSLPYYQMEYVFNRRVLYEPPGVGFPPLKSPLSLGHVANAMSLLASAFSRKS